ncbi:dystrophin [Plakobranchus ocellatus]|uniref:Dystrophin n=1 Tax=Plakobranchus ocellatus TaxID=259542 RepID=A0AAV3Y3R3_9GAST|nr:dystrophin [Plakobranchus ocellatus]
MNVEIPDKKSVMTYLMCLFQELPHSIVVSRSNNNTSSSSGGILAEATVSPSSPRSGSVEVDTGPVNYRDKGLDISETPMSMSSSGSRHSAMSTVSVELLSYQDSLENVLTWLLEAEEVLDKQQPVAEEVGKVKEQFNQHEEFMVELTRHQDSIGGVLKEGNDLLSDGKVTADEEKEIRTQMSLLNNRWEELRVKALDRQSRLQTVLMELQQGQLDDLASWLTSMEERIEKQQSIGADLDAIKAQVEEHKAIQKSLEDQQKKVDSLQNMVVVVDDTNTESACAAMEQQLESLGKRWAQICRWTEEQWILLQELLMRWQQFSDEQAKFSDWLTEKEALLANMRTADLSTAEEVINQVRHLKSIENDMGEQVRRFDALNECGQQIVSVVDNQEAITRISALLEEFQERWEKLVQDMESQSKELSKVADVGDDEEVIEAETATGVASMAPVSPSSASKSKKRRVESASRAEFDVELKSVLDWMDRTESTLQLLVSDNPQEPFTVEEQRVLIQDTESSVRSHQIDVQRLLTLGQTILTELKIAGEPQDSLVIVIKGLEERWENLNDKLAETQTKVDLNYEMKKFNSELSALLELLSSYEKYINHAESIAEDASEITRQLDQCKYINHAESIAEDASEITRQLDQCKVKIKAMLAHQDRIEGLRIYGEQIVRQYTDADSVKSDFDDFLKKWNAVSFKYDERKKQLVEALDKVPPRTYLEATAIMNKWLHDIDDAIKNEKIQTASETAMNSQLETYKDLSKEIQDHTSGLEYINRTGRELINKSTPERGEELRADLQALNGLWTNVSNTIEQRQAKLEKSISNIQELKNQMDGLVRWMEEMDVFLHAPDPCAGDLPTLQAQLHESNGVEDDIKTLQANVKNINSIWKSQLSDAEPTFRDQVASEVADLNNRWDQVVKLASEQNARLAATLSNSQKVYDRIEALNIWLGDVKESLAHKDYAVENPNDLSLKAKKFQNLKAEIDERQKEVNNISEEANTMVTQAPSGSLQELARLLMRLTALWSDVQARVERYCMLFQTAEHKWTDMKNLMETEEVYLNALEKKVRKSSSASSDAEDISEELNDVETYLAEHSTENKRHIHTLATYLIDNCIMVETVRREHEEFLRKYEKLESDARNKIQQLEKFIQQAQTIERQMLDMSQWMVDVSQLLQNRLDADMLAGDVPQENETLQLEFKQQEELLEELEKNVQEYKQQGRMEASARLEQQTQLLKKHFDEVVVKFRKFQRPADFEPKMTHVWRELGHIQGTIHLVEVPSDDPQLIQQRHESCMKFYKTMSELKPEVETVLKTGRQIVERKQVDFPDSLGKQLDAIKQLYNELGAQIKQNKADLEKALKLSRKLKKELSLAREFMDSTREALEEREDGAGSYNTEEELSFLKSTQEEVVKREFSLTSVHDLIQQLQSLSEEVDVSDSRDQAHQLSQELQNLAVLLARRKTKLQEETYNIETRFVDFQTQIMKIKEWLGRAETIVGAHSRLSESQQRLTPHRETIKTMQKQMYDMRGQVDEIRDQAIELMAKSDSYTGMVEPELSHINQRWEELAQKIRERATSVPPESPTVLERRTITRVAFTPSKSSSSSPSASPSPSLSIGGSPTTRAPKVMGGEIFDEALAKLHSHMDVFEVDVATEGQVTTADYRRGLEETAKYVEEKRNALVQEINEVSEEGEKLLLAAETSRDPVTHARVSNKLQELKIRWLSIQKDIEMKKLDLATLLPLYNNFTEEMTAFQMWLVSAEERVEKVEGHDLEVKGANSSPPPPPQVDRDLKTWHHTDVGELHS